MGCLDSTESLPLPSAIETWVPHFSFGSRIWVILMPNVVGWHPGECNPPGRLACVPPQCRSFGAPLGVFRVGNWECRVWPTHRTCRCCILSELLGGLQGRLIFGEIGSIGPTRAYGGVTYEGNAQMVGAYGLFRPEKVAKSMGLAR